MTKSGANDAAISYRKHAATCVSIAKGVVSVSNRLALIDMAEAWIALAEQAEENLEFRRLCPPINTST
jgi:hypothetical protein